jgi:hypothetical protein
MLKALVSKALPGVGRSTSPEGSTFAAVAAQAVEGERIDRSQIERNADGCEEAHSSDPSLWRIGEAEVDLADGHSYAHGGQLWYLSSRARERIAAGVPIAAVPMNRRARASGTRWIPEPPPKQLDELGADDEALDADGGPPEVPGLDGLEANPPSREVVGPSGMKYEGLSLWSLRPADPPRRDAIRVIESRWFDPLILLAIGANCVTMAAASPLDPPGTLKASVIGACEWAFLLLFTAELALKVTAYGFYANDHAYLKDGWCKLDLAVVSLAWLPILVPAAGQVSAIRAVRALRPLRALKRLPGMPVLVNSILGALPQLSHVAW